MLDPSASSDALPSEERRLAALRRYGILDTPPTADFDRLTAFAARLFHAPFAGITVLDHDRLWVKSSSRPCPEALPRADSFCEVLLSRNGVFVVEDARADPDFGCHPLVAGPPRLRFYAGAPLRTPDGFCLGALCLTDTVPRSFPDESRALLSLLADIVMHEVERHRAGPPDPATLQEDISRRSALEESREYYRSLFEQNRDAVYSLDRQGRFLSANAACEALSGYAPEELIGVVCDELIVPEHRQQAQEMFARALAGEARHGEIAITHRDGRRVEIIVSKMPIVIQGEITGVFGISRDITRRIALERERERLLREAVARADRDELTGLLNHAAFHRQFHDALTQACHSGRPLAVLMLDLDDFRFLNDAYGHVAGDDVLRRIAAVLRDGPASDAVIARYGGDQFAILFPAADAAAAEALTRVVTDRLDRLDYRPPAYDSAVPITLSAGMACFPEDGTTRRELLAAADARLRRAKTGGDQQAERLRTALAGSVEGFSMLDALVTAVDNKDRYTRRHSEDVLAYSRRLAEALSWDARSQRHLLTAALLHDVGKIGVPDAILRKPGRLTDAEFAAVKQHPMMGAIIVGAVPGFEETLDAIRHHHERWDGGGYPFGLRGTEIPLPARLMAVADAFSAMTTDRPYRKGMAQERALAVLAQGAGTQWDPALVAAFVGTVS